ncbi:hypothetical protein GCM10009662_17900 [Catellatospora coxensis]|uniref:Uncharacterized protein n=2 Tax=Catellatospora coxensis TaxID=310354 RepID=A0A8J3LBI9_9ACTN|nr:hypothetical protein Cco03nite_82900 [Catellatospora coxensis]
MRWKALPAALLLLVAAACTPDRPAPAAPGTPAGSPTGSATPAGTPAGSASPTATADCGTHDLGHRGELPPDSLSCLLDAAGRHRFAVLRVTLLTVEGDPIRFTYTVQQDGQVEVLTDTREDAFGSRDVMRELCTGPAAGPPALQFARCSSPTPVR